jgi:mRNA interferase MazF
MKSGDVVFFDFPFSDLSGSKLRPAIIVSDVGGNDFIACQVTSNAAADVRAIQLSTASFAVGGLRAVSFARPGKLFTAHRSIFLRTVGRLNGKVRNEIREAIIEVIRQG